MKKTFKNTIVQSVQHPAVVLLFIVCVMLGTYSRVFLNDFVLGDYDFIVNWTLTQDWGNLPRYFFGFVPPEGHENVYTPLNTVAHMLAFSTWEFSLVMYHIFSLVVHAISVLLAYQLTLFLFRKKNIAFMASLFFAVHPLQVESVAYMSQSFSTLGYAFFLLSFYLYARSHPDASVLCADNTENDTAFGDLSGPRRHKMYIFSVITGGCAVFINELAAILPVVVVLYDQYCVKKDSDIMARIKRVVPFFLVVFFYGILKLANLGYITSVGYVEGNPYWSFLIVLKAWAKYVWMALVPVGLSFSHVISDGIFSFGILEFDREAVVAQSFLRMHEAAALGLVIGLMYVACRVAKKVPAVTFGIVWFFATLLASAHIIPGEVFFAERFAYLPLYGFCLVCATIIDALYNARTGRYQLIFRVCAVVCAVALIVFYIGRSFKRVEDWRTNKSIYEAAYPYNTNNARFLLDRGIMLIQDGSFNKAVESFREVLKMRPRDTGVYFALADVYAQRAEYNNAIDALKRVLAIDGNFAEAHYNLANLYAYKGRVEEARFHLEKAIDLYKKEGRVVEAARYSELFNEFWGPSHQWGTHNRHLRAPVAF